MDPRHRARQLASEAAAAGRPFDWFESLYREAGRGEAVVPWDDRRPNPHVVSWLDARRPAPGRALDVGCGLGDNAEELARRGFEVVAFDVAPTAVAAAQARFPETRVEYRTGNLLEPPPAWRGAFDLIVETYTLQVLPRPVRDRAAHVLRDLVAPGGTLLVVARGREPNDDPGQMPWPLTRDEIASLAAGDLALVSLEDFVDEEQPPVRRFRATLTRRAP